MRTRQFCTKDLASIPCCTYSQLRWGQEYHFDVNRQNNSYVGCCTLLDRYQKSVVWCLDRGSPSPKPTFLVCLTWICSKKNLLTRDNQFLVILPLKDRPNDWADPGSLSPSMWRQVCYDYHCLYLHVQTSYSAWDFSDEQVSKSSHNSSLFVNKGM